MIITVQPLPLPCQLVDDQGGLHTAKKKKRFATRTVQEELRASKATVAQLQEEAARAKDRAGPGAARERELELLRAEVRTKRVSVYNIRLLIHPIFMNYIY